MMMRAATAPNRSIDAAVMRDRPSMSNLRFFLTAYAGGLAFFWTILA